METRWTTGSHNILGVASGLVRYNRWLIGHFSKYFGKAILEIGSGQGALSRLLPKKAIIVLSDIFPEYLNGLKKDFSHPVMFLDIEKGSPLKLRGRIDSIFSSNVFEHLEEDEKAFLNCYQLLEPGGYLLLFVPARPEIYGKLDVQMGHFRRYTKRELKQKAEDAGFNVEKIYYANLPGYFLWWSRGILLAKLFGSKSKLILHDIRFAKIFDIIFVPFLYLERFIYPPIGQSLVLIARKEKLKN